jgi:hypothetical protein
MAASSDPIVIGDAKKADNKRLLTMGGAGVGLLLIVFLFTKVLGGGGSGNIADNFGAGPTVSTATSTTVPAASAPIDSSKNPFTPLFAVAGTTSSGSPAGMDATNTTVINPTVVGTTAPAATSTNPGGSTSTPVSGNPGSGTSVAPSSGIRFSLLEILDSGEATVQVDDTQYTVAVNDTFAENFRVSSTSTTSRCGTFVYGDQRVALCEGDEAVL